MTTRNALSERFRALHVSGYPVVLVNVWDAGSAATIEECGATAIATSSWAIAAAHGYPDGERIPSDLMMSAFELIARTVTVPLTVDIESGYGGSPEAVTNSVERVLCLGACGCNLEDRRTDSVSLRSVDEQVELIRAARVAADRRDGAFFVNARTDVFLLPSDGSSTDSRLREVIERGRAYAQAGADGLFVPGLSDPDLIAEVVGEVALPINVMVLDMHADLDPYRAAGVARISFGPAPYLHAISALRAAAQKCLPAAAGA